MTRDYIKEQGYRALDNRLKRISDRMAHDTRKFFKRVDLDVEPSWHLIFKLLKENDQLTMVEMADQIGYTHPSMVVTLKKMTSRGYVFSERDDLDKRKYNIKLTQKSMDLLPHLEEMWESCEKAIYEMLEGDLSILKQLDKLESSLKTIPLNKRFYKHYSKNKINEKSIESSQVNG